MKGHIRGLLMTELTAFALAVATGIVTAGLTSSFYRLVTNRPLSFSLLAASVPEVVTGVATLVFAGPMVIMRNAVRARVLEQRPLVWLALSASISVFWAFMSGVFVMSLILAR
ncbi:hypothetical protein GCM10011587_11770 [Pyruvatibacter mobilis]|nr:hypothetical protein GCM10011587_11770 [Pyruvatibacter mobilis]